MLTLLDTHATDLAGLERLTGLRELVVEANTLRDLAPLRSLTGLERLRVNATVTHGHAISGLHGLRRLHSTSAPLPDLAGLQALEALHIGHAADGHGFLARLTGLRELDLRYARLDDLSVLTGLHALTTLNLVGVPATDLRPLYTLPNLRQLHAPRHADFDTLRAALPLCAIRGDG